MLLAKNKSIEIAYIGIFAHSIIVKRKSPYFIKTISPIIMVDCYYTIQYTHVCKNTHHHTSINTHSIKQLCISNFINKLQKYLLRIFLLNHHSIV